MFKPPRQTMRCLWTMFATIKHFSNNNNKCMYNNYNTHAYEYYESR